VGWRMSSIKEAFVALSVAAKTMELKVNEEKTKFMQVSKIPVISSKTDTGSYNFETAQEFKYL
jgi:hypothetical protein